MRNFELTILLTGKVTPAKKRLAKELIEKLVKVAKGKVDKLDDWGERELAYPIDKSTAGNYLHFKLELNPESVANLNTKLNLEESIARYLLVKKGESASA